MSPKAKASVELVLAVVFAAIAVNAFIGWSGSDPVETTREDAARFASLVLWLLFAALALVMAGRGIKRLRS